MKFIKDCPDKTILNLWYIPDQNATLGEVYKFMSDYLYNGGYDDVTPPKIRRRIKRILRRYRLVPRQPTLKDYKQSRAPKQKYYHELQ